MAPVVHCGINVFMHHQRGRRLNKPSASGNIQLIWGVVYILAGLSVFYNLHKRLPEIVEFRQSLSFTWSIRIAFYIIGIILIGGGILKVVNYFKQKQSDHSQIETTDSQD